ncbi:MAG: polysaccharide biosynthesis C-terminal domain-containing protein [Oscillospiraceae bacterium]|nr:polysaccharide biosynthesis C-terminal domain-containing protein [Oscillospiraceae bacterium]
MILRAAGLAFNALLARHTGTAAIGVMSLIFSLFDCIMVLADGNIFVSTSRFVSEEAQSHGSISHIMRLSFGFSAVLSGSFTVLSFAFSDMLAVKVLSSPELGTALRILSFSLIPAAVGSCIKGYFHGIRKVSVPMIGEATSFLCKWLCMGIMLFLPVKMSFYSITAASVFTGEVSGFLYYTAEYIKSLRCRPDDGIPAIKSLPEYMKLNLPIVAGGYVQMIMSAANETIVPAKLLECSSSADEALSCYGMFEAMIIPAIFFPAVAMSSMSLIIIPESAAAVRAGGKRPSELVHDSFSKAFGYSLFVMGLFLLCGGRLGRLICPESTLVSRSITILAPVIPFIYLEFVLEGLLKGMGKQSFSTLNSLAEYIIRIACVAVFVPLIGFNGVIVSYYASNCVSNIARIVKVCRCTDTSFDIYGFIILPMIKAAVCCSAGAAVGFMLPHISDLTVLAAQISAAGIVYTLSSKERPAGQLLPDGVSHHYSV